MDGPRLDPRLPRMVACIVLGDWPELEALRRGAPDGAPDRAWREAVLQAHLFAGFPRLVEAFGVLEAAGGLGRPEPEELGPLGSREAGRELFARIYADQADPVRRSLESHHPVLATWIERHAYGDVLARPGLDAGSRELLAVACLIALDQPRQLMSHARGALRCGATLAELDGALEAVRDLVPSEVADRALRVLRATRSAASDRAELPPPG